MEEGNLAHNISALRKTLGEPATGQKYVETVPGRGYRFVATCERSSAANLDLGTNPASRCQTGFRALVQRRNELRSLDHCFERALRGTRQVVFVSGEAGIGKTTVVDAFAEQARGKTGYGLVTANAWTIAALAKRTCRCWRRSAACAGKQPERT